MTIINLKPIMSPLTIEQLHTFHAHEREIFSKLVLKLSRPPSESLLVMATWLWLEDFGLENFFSNVVTLPDKLITSFANEAVYCFRCLEFNEPPNATFNHIPLTSSFTKNHISLPMIYKHRYTAIAGIKTFLTTVCSRAFSDILQQLPSCFVSKFNNSLIIPGFPHQTFGNINVMTDVVAEDNPFNNVFLFPNGVWKWNTHCLETENDRTMFLTFSRGFPVSQAEVKELFTTKYGDNCVVGVYMKADGMSAPNTNENGNDQHQTLFARLVLDSVVTVDRILEGQKLQKFRINGKHIWARKYNEKKDGRTCLFG